MQSTERRIAALESKAYAADASLKVVIARVGEIRADATKRSGYAPDDKNMMCVVFGQADYAKP